LSTRIARASGNQVRRAQDQAALRPPEQLVAGRRHQGRSGSQRRRRVRFGRQPWVRREQAGADVGDQRYAERGEPGDRNRRGEALDPEVRRMDLEHERRVGTERGLVVGQVHAVGRAHLAQPGSDGLQQLRDAEAVTDLDQLAARDDHLAAHAQGRGHQGERRRAVVDHVYRAGVRHGRGQGGQRSSTAWSPTAGQEVELDVGVARRRHHRVDRGPGKRRPAEVGVDHHAGGVDDRPHRARRRWQPGDDVLDHAVRRQAALAHALECLGDGVLDDRTTQPDRGVLQAGVGEDDVRARRAAPGIGRSGCHDVLLTEAALGGGGRESNPPDRGARSQRF
jgi:hypothetical protein